jgi:hypothetical protein
MKVKSFSVDGGQREGSVCRLTMVFSKVIYWDSETTPGYQYFWQ